jgi:hypothetical protein
MMTNLNGVTYYSPEQPFLDVLKTGNGWVTQTPSIYDTGEEQYLQLDPNGWVTSLAGAGRHKVQFTQVAVLVQRSFPNPYYPRGKYIVLYDGQGTLSYGLDAVKDIGLSAPGRDVLNVANPSDAGFSITISATDPKHAGDYIRNIRVVHATNESALRSGQIFSPTFTRRISPFRGFRFMDWMGTNNSVQQAWGGRPRQSYAFWGQFGVPIEVMVALANQQNADAWFNMPHMATDDYMQQFATLVHSTLNSKLKVYVEYSNETWNYIFSQATWIQSTGSALWNVPVTFEVNRDYYGMRSSQMCELWKNAWGVDRDRVICVLGAQAANTYTATESLACPLWKAGAPCTKYGLSAIAIAPYFGYDVPAAWTAQTDGGLSSLFTEIEQGGLAPGGHPGGMIKQAMEWVVSYKAVANSNRCSSSEFLGQPAA